MRTIIMLPIRVRKRLCVSVFGGKPSIYFSKIKKCFGFCGYCVKEIVILNSVFGFVVLNSIWEYGSNTFFDIFETFQTMSQKCEQFSYGTFGGIFLGFLVPYIGRSRSIKIKSAMCFYL